MLIKSLKEIEVVSAVKLYQGIRDKIEKKKS